MARLAQVFVPNDRQFFDLFEEATGNILKDVYERLEAAIDAT